MTRTRIALGWFGALALLVLGGAAYFVARRWETTTFQA